MLISSRLVQSLTIGLILLGLLVLTVDVVSAQGKKNQKKSQVELRYPPELPNGIQLVTDRSPEFLIAPATLREQVSIASAAPTVDFMFYPGQNYPGKPWSNWGDSQVANGKYYSAIGDHLAINGKGDGTNGVGAAHVFQYDPVKKSLTRLVDTSKLLQLPAGRYAPGKIHSRIDMGRDGWLYYATHRGSIRATTDEFHYRGDWILRSHPATGVSEIVAHAPVSKHAIPASILDPDRMIFYGSTAPGFGREDEGIRFFAFDVKKRKLLYEGAGGPARYLMFARSTGRVYFVPDKGDGQLMRYDPTDNRPPVEVKGSLIGVRAATKETRDGFIYTVSLGQRSGDAAIWSFNTKTEETRKIGSVAVGSQAYVATIDVDPSGRFLYFLPGAHGGSAKDGTPVVQFDIRTGRKKVIAFLDPFYTRKYGFTLKGTYGAALSATGDKLFVTWNVSRGSRAWDCCGLTVIHIPASER